MTITLEKVDGETASTVKCLTCARMIHLANTFGVVPLQMEEDYMSMAIRHENHYPNHDIKVRLVGRVELPIETQMRERYKSLQKC